jgi:hypothetical protein
LYSDNKNSIEDDTLICSFVDDDGDLLQQLEQAGEK